MGRWKKMTFKNLIFGNFWGPEVVGSSLYQKNIGAQFTHLYVPSLCKEFFVMRHNIGHSSGELRLVELSEQCILLNLTWFPCISTFASWIFIRFI